MIQIKNLLNQRKSLGGKILILSQRTLGMNSVDNVKKFKGIVHTE